jgi:hypothetical protein
MRIARFHRDSGHIFGITEGDFGTNYSLVGTTDIGMIEVDPDVTAQTHWIELSTTAKPREVYLPVLTRVNTALPGVATTFITGLHPDARVMIMAMGGVPFDPVIMVPEQGPSVTFQGMIRRTFAAAGLYHFQSVGRFIFGAHDVQVGLPVVVDPLNPGGENIGGDGGPLIEYDPPNVIVLADARGAPIATEETKTITLISDSTLINIVATSGVCTATVGAANVITLTEIARSGYVTISADIGTETITRRVPISVFADTSSATIDVKKAITATPGTANWQDVVSGEIVTGAGVNGAATLLIAGKLNLGVTATNDAFLVIRAKIMIQALGFVSSPTQHPEPERDSPPIRNFVVVGGSLNAAPDQRQEIIIKERQVKGLAVKARYRVTLQIIRMSGAASLDDESFGVLYLDGVD